MRIIFKNSDILGTMSSTLCLIHCIITPLLFFVPFWWTGLNFIFIIVSFFAVYGSVKNTSRKIMKPLLWFGFIFLCSLIINEEIVFFHLPEFVTYIAATNLAFLHIYNLKYCQCDDEECCSQK